MIAWEGGAATKHGDPYEIVAETADYCLSAVKLKNGQWRWSVEGFAADEEAAKRAMAAMVRRAGFRLA